MPVKKPSKVIIEDTAKPLPVVLEKKGLSDTVKIAIIAGIVTLGQAWIAVSVNKVNSKVQEVHKQINSRMDQMLELVGEKSKAEGVIQGKANQVTDDSLIKVNKSK